MAGNERPKGGDPAAGLVKPVDSVEPVNSSSVEPEDPTPERLARLFHVTNHQVVGTLAATAILALILAVWGWTTDRVHIDLGKEDSTAAGPALTASPSPTAPVQLKLTIPTALSTAPVNLSGQVAGLGPNQVLWAFNEPIDGTDDVYPIIGPCAVEGGTYTCGPFPRDVSKHESYRYWVTVLDTKEGLAAAVALDACPSDTDGDQEPDTPGSCPYKTGVPGDSDVMVHTDQIDY